MIEVPSFVIFMFCLIGCGIQAHALGKQVGVENTIQYLHDQGIVEFDEFTDE